MNKSQKKKLDALWSKAVRTRDGFMCQRCYKTPKARGTHAHHIFRRNVNASRWDILNGITMCFGCHKWVDNDPNAYKVWIMNKIGVKNYADLERKHNIRGDFIAYEAKKKELENALHFYENEFV